MYKHLINLCHIFSDVFPFSLIFKCLKYYHIVGVCFEWSLVANSLKHMEMKQDLVSLFYTFCCMGAP